MSQQEIAISLAAQIELVEFLPGSWVSIVQSTAQRITHSIIFDLESWLNL
jgi:hypothetical protein